MKISVIIPAYNHEKYIAAAINSVLSQGCQDFEIIIVNDGSTDSTEQMILTFQDQRIRYISQENSGAHSAINRGISLAEGEYISILNSDDIYLPNRLETCLTFLENNAHYSAAISTVEGIYSDGTPLKDRVTPLSRFWLDWYRGALPFFNEDKFYPNAFAKNILITTSNLFARRKCFQECGGFKALRYAHDWDMLLRLAKRYQIHLIGEDLLKYRMHSENTVHESESGFKVQFEVNWLVVENLKELNPDLAFDDILELLKNNHDLFLDAMFFLSMIKDRPAFYDLVDLNHPRTIQLLRLIELGVSIASTIALQARVEDLQAWTQDLQKGMAWLASQCRAWEKATNEREQVIASLQDHVQDLQTGHAWLKSQCEAWEKNAAEQGKAVADLSSRLQDMNERLNKIQSHLGVRILNRLTGRKLF
ncbi:MAG: glycosyltransferase [Deltaproteobacteria bacterium]|nr:glycosyltransferase [Deltaproteobacteria bacterium]